MVEEKLFRKSDILNGYFVQFIIMWPLAAINFFLKSNKFFFFFSEIRIIVLKCKQYKKCIFLKFLLMEWLESLHIFQQKTDCASLN